MTQANAFLSLVTLGVADLARARAFYQALGWTVSGASNEHVAFLHGAGSALGLYPRHLLAEDAMVADTPTGFSAVALANNMASEAEVDAFLARAEKAGATILKPAQKVFWGGYSGYFADLDGHLWEVAHNPFFAVENGRLRLPA